MATHQDPTILLVDSNALIHRAFHAFPTTLTTRKGELVNAVYGFARLLLQVLADFHPEYTVCVFDTSKPTFRHEMYTDYKATRAKTDEALVPQFERVRELVKALNIPILMVDGYEADDVIGSIVKGKITRGLKKVVISGDKDLLQLLDKETEAYLAAGSFSQSILYDIPKAGKKLGFDPKYLTDYKGLCGDPSDNIPGVKGIGDKTAVDLIQKYGDLETIYKHLADLKPAVKKKLETEKEMAFFSKKLATIITDIKLNFTLQDARLADYDYDKAVAFFHELEFRSLISKLPKTAHQPEVQQNQQLDFLSQPQNAKAINQINSLDDLKAIQNQLQQEDFLAVRSQTLEPSDIFSPIKTLAIAGKKVKCILSGDCLRETNLLSKLLSAKLLVAHDAKRELHAFTSSKLRVGAIGFDAMIAAYLVFSGSGKFDLASLAFNLFGINFAVAKSEDASPEQLLEEATIIYQLHQELSNKLDIISAENNSGWSLKRLFSEIEMPLVAVLANMERQGITLDVAYLQKFAKELSAQIKTLEKKIYADVGHEFNIASPRQLGQVLFEEMHLPAPKKTKNGSFSTNEKVLAHLSDAFPIIRNLFDYRELSKLKSTYTQALIDQVNQATGRIHTSYNQAVAATGRLSSTNPNLQNIPISTDLGKKIRQAFVAEPKHLLVSFDYSQQELRLLAHFSGEAKLEEAFNNKIDIHALTASQIFHKQVQDVDSHERRIGKTVNFGVIYGMSSYGLADRLRISREEAQLFIDTFFASYPRVREYFDKLLQQARTQGYVETLMGRRKNTAGMANAAFQVRAAIEREVINFPLQGSAADMMKASMLRTAESCERNFPDFAYLALQIHDELVFEVATDNHNDTRLRQFILDIKEIMLHVIELKVSMDLNVEVGNDLANLEELKLET